MLSLYRTVCVHWLDFGFFTFLGVLIARQTRINKVGFTFMSLQNIELQISTPIIIVKNNGCIY